jgi:hypothetical protein
MEGALVKSILNAPRVAVVAIDSAYSSELSSALVIRFDQNPTTAAAQLYKRLLAPPTSRLDVKIWHERIRVYARLLERISNAVWEVDSNDRTNQL